SYTGSGPMSCAAAMNKVRAKQFFREAGLQTPRWLEFDHSNIQHFITKVTDSFDFPVVIKPVDCGSSVGVRIVQHKRELPEEVRGARDRFDSFLIEEFIPGKEITAGVLELKGKATPLPLIELRVLHEEFYNFKAKYTPGETEFFVPADLPPPTEEKLKQAALAAHRQLDCSDYSRVDIRLTESGTPFLLEINALPGMTETSDLPLAAEALDIDYPSLVRHMLDSALEDL
ncbi:MAG: D-alanine--D-alanine ligase family protein, partial [Candidatus Bipolaricaulota bacterium]